MVLKDFSDFSLFQVPYFPGFVSLEVQHCEAVAGGGAAEGSLLHKAGGGGVVDKVVAEMAWA